MNSHHAIIQIALDGAVIQWNTGAEKLFGYLRGEMLGHSLTVLVPHEGLDEHREIMEAIGRGAEDFRSDAVRLHKSGRFIIVCLTVSPLRDTNGQATGAIIAAHGLADSGKGREQNLDAQKVETFTRLARGVAHDFNNLLTIILGYCDVIISRYHPDEIVSGHLAEIQRAGHRAGVLIQQLLAMGHTQVSEPKALNLKTAIEDSVKMLQRVLGERIPLTTNCPAHVPAVEVDPAQMQYAILHLAIKARQAMPEGGRLAIETASVLLDDSYAQAHPTVRPGKYVLLAFSDTGAAAGADAKARIFEPLFPPGEAGAANDVELTTIHAIVAKAGGHIEVGGTDVGTALRIYLPEASEPVHTGKPHFEVPAMPRGDETILLAEDEDAVRTFASHILRTCGYTVLEARNGEEAVAIGTSHREPIHLVVSNVAMPLRGGILPVEYLLALNLRFKVLFLSGHSHETMILRGTLKSEAAFLQKPFSPAEIVQRVREVLDGTIIPQNSSVAAE